MKFGFRRKKTAIITDEMSVKILFDDDFSPESNDQIKQVVEEVSAAQAQQGLPPIEQSLPFATLKTAEDLFSKIRDKIASADTSTIAVPFKYVAIWEFDPNKKQNSSNPSESIVLENFEVPYDYQNFTKSVFEEIFNDPSNADINYESKLEYCKSVKRAYMAATNVDDREIARIPERAEVENGAVSLDVPIFDTQIQHTETIDKQPLEEPNTTIAGESPKKLAKTDVKKTNSDDVYYDADNHTFSNVDPSLVKIKVPEKQPSEKQPARNVISNPNPRKNGTSNRLQAQKLNAQHEMFSENAEAQQQGRVQAPRFPISTIQEVGPADDRYVSFMLNEHKKYLNELLKNAEEKINQKNRQDILTLTDHYDKTVENAVQEFKKDNDPIKGLHDAIESKLLDAKNEEFAALTEDIDRDQQRRLEQAKQEFEAQQSQINQDHDQQIRNTDDELSEKYTTMAQREYTVESKKRLDKFKTDTEKVKAKQLRENELGLQKNISNQLIKSHDVLETFYKELVANLDEYQAKTESEHLNALSVATARDRAEAEKRHSTAPYDELKQLTTEKMQLKEAVATLQAQNAGLEKSKSELTASLQSRERENINLTRSLELASTAPKPGKTDQPEKTTIDRYIELQLAQNMAEQTAQDKAKNSKTPSNTVENESLNNVTKGLRRSVVGLLMVLVLGAGGTGFFIHQQNTQHNQQIQALQKTMSKRHSTTSTKANTKNTSTDASSATTQSTDVNATEDAALHSENLAKVQSNQGATYQVLDEAILSKNATQVQQALSKLDNLKLNDDYRTTQVESILNNAHNSDLANNVKNANQ